MPRSLPLSFPLLLSPPLPRTLFLPLLLSCSLLLHHHFFLPSSTSSSTPQQHKPLSHPASSPLPRRRCLFGAMTRARLFAVWMIWPLRWARQSLVLRAPPTPKWYKAATKMLVARVLGLENASSPFHDGNVGCYRIGGMIICTADPLGC